jgi:hypothetical protein
MLPPGADQRSFSYKMAKEKQVREEEKDQDVATWCRPEEFLLHDGVHESGRFKVIIQGNNLIGQLFIFKKIPFVNLNPS